MSYPTVCRGVASPIVRKNRTIGCKADGLACLSRLQFAKAMYGAMYGKEMLYNLTPIIFQSLAANLSGLTAGMDKITVHSGSFAPGFP